MGIASHVVLSPYNRSFLRAQACSQSPGKGCHEALDSGLSWAKIMASEHGQLDKSSNTLAAGNHHSKQLPRQCRQHTHRLEAVMSSSGQWCGQCVSKARVSSRGHPPRNLRTIQN